MPRKDPSYVIFWKTGDRDQYASKAAAVDALEKNGPDKALCVIKGELVEFGARVIIDDRAPRRAPVAAPRKRKAKEPTNGSTVTQEFFEKAPAAGEVQT
jgi:hypothetical protein